MKVTDFHNFASQSIVRLTIILYNPHLDLSGNFTSLYRLNVGGFISLEPITHLDVVEDVLLRGATTIFLCSNRERM